MMKSLCGLRPTGQLHIGHYFAVIEPSLAGADTLIAEYHAPKSSEKEILNVISTLNRFGVSNIIRQKDIFNPSLYFKMMDLTTMGELNRMTQFQASSTPSAHLFSYPVLMACDLIGYDVIIVGEDQGQHLNFARNLIDRYNKKYQTDITIPIAKPEAGRIMDLKNPKKKMSKSEPAGCLFLDDSPDTITKKIRKATADESGRKNLLSLYKRLGGTDEPEMNIDLKNSLSEKIIKLLS